MKITVEDNSDENIFLAYDESGGLVGDVMYVMRDGYYDIYHTAIEPEFEGKGVAAKMVNAVLHCIRSKNMKIFARCPYTSKYIKKHPEFNDLLLNQGV